MCVLCLVTWCACVCATRRAVIPLKIKIPVKICVENQQTHQLLIQFINYVWYLLHVSALHCHLQGGFLVPSERSSTEKQSREYFGSHHVTRHNTPIHNILS